MEIVTIVLDGELEHKDSLGNGGVIRPGEIQRMSAGTGIAHSEFNPSKENPVHLLQLWFFPEVKNMAPSYEQIAIPQPSNDDRFVVLADRNGSNGAATIHQDIKILRANLKDGESADYTIGEGRGVFMQVARGSVTLDGEALKEGDGAQIEKVPGFALKATADAEVLLFDMA